MTPPRALSGVAALALLPLLLHVALCVLAGPGFMASDDYDYARMAHEVNQGRFELTPHHRANRLGLIHVTALSYRIFGPGEFASVLWPALCSLVVIALVFHLAYGLAGPGAACIASFLAAASPPMVSSSLLLMPDGAVGCLMFSAAAATWAGRRAASARAGALWGAGTALLLMFAILTKLSAVWIGPFLIVLLAVDLRRRRNSGFWCAAIVAGALLLVAHFAAYRIATGDWLYRLHGIEDTHNQSRWAFGGEGGPDLVRRVTWAPLMMILEGAGFAVPLILALPVMLGLRGPRGRGRDATRFWTLFVAALLLSFWFGTTSFSTWNPIPLISRMFLPLFPPLCILAGVFLAGLWPRGHEAAKTRPAGSVLAAAFLVAALLMFRHSKLLAGYYLGFALVAAALLAAPRRSAVPFARRAAVAGILASVLVSSVWAVARGGVGETKPQAAEREVFARFLAPAGPLRVVFTDPRTLKTADFRFGFELPSHLWLTDAPPPARALLDSDARSLVYVYVNEERLGLIAREDSGRARLRSIVARRRAGWEVLYSKDGVTLYRVPPEDGGD